MLEVLRSGPLATVQDRGRKGFAHLGVPRSGALDQGALDQANALVGNSFSAAGIEIAQGRFGALFHVDALYAVAGANSVAATDVKAGETIEIGPSAHGMFSYLAVRGGIDAPVTLGSRSTDTLSGIGPPILRRGSFLAIGNETGDVAGPASEGLPTGDVRVRVRWGPRSEWFSRPEEVLSGYQMKVLNRVGARLAGLSLTRAVTAELPSEGLIAGAVQVPPDGQPIIFLADHPTTGGYPVIAVVHPADLPLVAQTRPGTKVVFYGPER